MANRLPLIAVVDDEESVRMALARMLRASSFDVSIYRSGEDFLESLKTVVPDCAVLDYQMPGLTGRDVQRALAACRAALGEEAFDAAWAAGRALTVEQAIAEAVDDAAEAPIT